MVVWYFCALLRSNRVPSRYLVSLTWTQLLCNLCHYWQCFFGHQLLAIWYDVPFLIKWVKLGRMLNEYVNQPLMCYIPYIYTYTHSLHNTHVPIFPYLQMEHMEDWYFWVFLDSFCRLCLVKPCNELPLKVDFFWLLISEKLMIWCMYINIVQNTIAKYSATVEKHSNFRGNNNKLGLLFD